MCIRDRRSAVSIARRLADPLAELVKIDPKAIGVGQYQHDMPQARLSEALNGVVEDCVNSVSYTHLIVRKPLQVIILAVPLRKIFCLRIVFLREPDLTE